MRKRLGKFPTDPSRVSLQTKESLKGDQGYCYIPYDYIMDRKLTGMACAVKKLDVETMAITTQALRMMIKTNM